MALMHGKQIKDTSVSLSKLSGSGVVSFNSATMSFNSGSKLVVDYNISSGTDVVNKNYVDAVASGLDAKVPVRVVSATGSITLSGENYMIDGFTVSSGDRVLVASQAGPNIATSSNGIYVVSSGAWSRSTDADGNPSSEVSHGNFVFVTDGVLYEHTGWVLTITDATNPDQILVGTNSQGWVQFAEQANIRAGNGLTYEGQTLNVGAGTGITVSSDSVSIANTTVVSGSYGQANSVSTFTVNSQGQLTAAGTQSINITSTQVSDFDVAVESSIFKSDNFVDGSTVDFTVTTGDSVTAEVKLSSLTASRFDIINSASASNGWKLGYNNSGQFEWFDPTLSDISEVVAGNGLSGGGNSGSVTLDVNLGVNSGLTFSGDDIIVDSNIAGKALTLTNGVLDVIVGVDSGLTYSGDSIVVDSNIAGNGLDISNGVLTVNTSEITSSLAGVGLVPNGGSLDISLGVNSGLTFSGDSVIVDSNIAGNSLSFSSGVINIETTINKGLTSSSNDSSGTLEVLLPINGGLTFSDGGIIPLVDNSTIQVVGGKLSVVGGATQPKYTQRNLSVVSNLTEGVNYQSTGITMSFTPSQYSYINVYVNGVLQYLGDGVRNSVDCYFSSDSGASAKNINNISVGDTLYWNADLDNDLGAGFALSTTDKIDIMYQS